MSRLNKRKIDFLTKREYRSILWFKKIDFNYYYDKLLEDCLKGKRFEYLDCYGKDRCKIRTPEDAVKLINSDTFNSGHIADFSYYGPMRNITNRNVSAIFRYQYRIINEDVLTALDELIASDNFKGDREYCLKRIKFYTLKLYKEKKIRNILPDRILYFELAD